jgi:hypothetical protein
MAAESPAPAAGSMRRRLIAAGIVVFWLVMTGTLLYREVWRPAFGHTVPLRSTERPMDMWLAIYNAGGDRVGYFHSASFPQIRDRENGARLSVDAVIRVPVLGLASEFALTGTAWISKETGLREFDLRLRTGEETFRVEGEIAGGALRANLHAGGRTTPFSFPIGDHALLMDGVGLTAANLPVLEPGKTAWLDAFNPLGMTSVRARLECVGKETLEVRGEQVETFIIEINAAGFSTRSWVTAAEEVVKVETPFGFVLKAVEPEAAFAPIVLRQ